MSASHFSKKVNAYRVVLQQWRQGNALCIMPGNVVDQRQFATGTGDQERGGRLRGREAVIDDPRSVVNPGTS